MTHWSQLSLNEISRHHVVKCDCDGCGKQLSLLVTVFILLALLVFSLTYNQLAATEVNINKLPKAILPNTDKSFSLET